MVDGLVSIYDRVLRDGRPCLVSLEAPSGWGKTRVGREFYRRLVARRPMPRYWPDEINDPDQGRKAVRPAKFEKGRGALPEFFWWGIACSVRNGQSTGMLREDLQQLDDHKVFLEEARRGLVPWRKRVGAKVNKVARALGEEGGMEAAAKVGETFADAAVPALGISVRLVRMGVKAGRERLQVRRAVAEPSLVGGSDASDIVDDSVALLGDISRAGLPVVVFVEDIHKGDAMLLELLDRLLGVEGPILVISTTWPDKVDSNSELADLLNKHDGRYDGRVYRVDDKPEAGEPFAPGARFAVLDDEARRAIVRGYYPKITLDVLEALTDCYNNPWVIELACERLKRHHPGERLGIGPEKITEILPLDVRGFYLDIWAEISNETRLALAVAHVISPANIVEASRSEESSGRRDGGENRWTQPVLLDVIKHLDLPDRDAVLAELDNAPHAYAWVRVIDDYLRSFAEDVQSEVVKKESNELLQDALDTSDAHQRVLETLASVLIAEHDKYPDTTNRARSILVLHAEEILTNQQLAAQAIHSLLVDLHDAPRELPERVRLYEDYLRLDRQQIPTETQFSIRHHGAAALGESGNTNKAITACEALLADQLPVLGADHPDTLTTRNNLACWLGEAGRVDEAVSAFEALLADQLPVLGADHPDTLTTRNNLACWLGEAGRVDEAVSAFEAVLEDRLRVLGADHPDTLTTRHNLACWLGRAGRVDEAVSAFEAVLEDRLRVLGADHPNTLTTRNNLTSLLGKPWWRVDEAVSAFEALLVDRLRVLGADHPRTLATRHNLADRLGEAGRVDEAVTVFESLMEDRLRVLGADHPDTLATRHNLADRLGEAGRVDEAVSAFESLMMESLLAHELRVLGADHPNTPTTRNNLADRLGEAGWSEEAVSAFEWLLEDRLRMLRADASDAPATLATRIDLASRRGKAGRMEEAVTVFEAHLVDQLRVLGVDHPHTLATRHNLADGLGEAGRVDEAVTVFEALLEDRLRVLGADHPDTLATRNDLASWLGRVGRVEEAVSAFEALLVDQLRVLGADHPRTFTTRNNLAYLLGRAG